MAEEGGFDFSEIEAAPAASEVAAAAEAALAPVTEVKRRRNNSNWKRPVSLMYAYNYDYGENYYKVRWFACFFFCTTDHGPNQN